MIENISQIVPFSSQNIQSSAYVTKVGITQLELNTNKSAPTLNADNYVPQPKVKIIPFSEKSEPLAKPINKPGNYMAPLDKVSGKPENVHFFFFSDSHSRFPLMNKFIDIANRENPDLILDAGDIIHDGTEPEFDRAYSDRAKLNSPLYMVIGNHDIERRGPFTKPVPTLPPFQSFDFKGAHFIMIDDEDQYITDEQFKTLETDLEMNKDKPIIVSMHVPALSSKTSLIATITHKLPLDLANPTLINPQEVERFTSLMSKYKVAAVISGHTHKPDEFVKDGVKYITAAATGGLTPGMGIQNEFLDINLKGKEVEVNRVELKEASNDPVSFFAKTFDYYSDINSFNHNAIGWNYVPTTGVQYKAGSKVTETKRGESISGTITGELEKNNGSIGKSSEFVSFTLGIGEQDLNTQMALGYKYRILGDFNKNIFLSGAGTANAGIVTGKMSAGVGVGLSAGAEYKNLTFAIGQEWATNYKATTASVGYRF